jgi:hypothetical protein
MHRAALQGLRLVGNKLTAKEEEAHHNEGTHKPRSPHCHNSPRHMSRSRRSRSPSPKYYKSPRNGGTRRSQSPNKAYDYDDDENKMGAPCFTRRVHATPVPKGFKLPHDQQKYNGSQDHSHGLRLSTRSQNIRGLKRDSNAKSAAPPHRRGTVMVG